MSIEPITVPLHAITLDEDTQVRVAISQERVKAFADAMAAGHPFPPIMLYHDRTRYWLVDGFHRVLAAHRNQWMSMRAEVYPGTRADALWAALAANKINGHRLSTEDKRRAITLAVKEWPERSQRMIADQLGVSQSFVSTVRVAILGPEADVRGRDGKVYPANRAVELTEHKIKQREEIEALVRAGVKANDIRAQLRARPQDIAIVRRAMGVSTNIDRSRAGQDERLKRMRKLAEEGYTSRQIAQEVGLVPETCRVVLKKAGIKIKADDVVRGTHHIDSNRVLAQMVMDAEHLTADTDLIAVDELDPTQVGAWVTSLRRSRAALSKFITTLTRGDSNGQD